MRKMVNITGLDTLVEQMLEKNKAKICQYYITDSFQDEMKALGEALATYDLPSFFRNSHDYVYMIFVYVVGAIGHKTGSYLNNALAISSDYFSYIIARRIYLTLAKWSIRDTDNIPFLAWELPNSKKENKFHYIVKMTLDENLDDKISDDEYVCQVKPTDPQMKNLLSISTTPLLDGGISIDRLPKKCPEQTIEVNVYPYKSKELDDVAKQILSDLKENINIEGFEDFMNDDESDELDGPVLSRADAKEFANRWINENAKNITNTMPPELEAAIVKKGHALLKYRDALEQYLSFFMLMCCMDFQRHYGIPLGTAMDDDLVDAIIDVLLNEVFNGYDD